MNFVILANHNFCIDIQIASNNRDIFDLNIFCTYENSQTEAVPVKLA
jgi:hypothetical protein